MDIAELTRLAPSLVGLRQGRRDVLVQQYPETFTVPDRFQTQAG